MVLLALALLAGDQDVGELIRRLASERIEERERAYEALKAVGTPAVPKLREAAGGADPEIRLRASRLLRVIDILDHLNPNLRQAYPGLEEALASGDGKYIPKFLEAASRGYGADDLDNREELARLAVASARTNDEKLKIVEAAESALVGAEPVAALLRDKDPLVRRQAARALGEIGRRRKMRALAIGPLVDALKDEDSRVRANAVDALANLKHGPAAALLLDCCEDKSARVRRQAAEALGVLRAAEAVPKLADLLGDADAYVRLAAVESLGDLQARDRVAEIKVLLSDPERRVRGRAAEALGKLDARDAAGAIAALLGDDDREIWGKVVRALGDLDARAAGTSIVKTLKDMDRQTRRDAAWAVGRLDVREAIPGLLDLLDDGDVEVQREAMAALGALNAREAAGPLRARLQNRRLAVEAASALCELGLDDGVPALVSAGRTTSINALAHPKAWKAMATTPWAGRRKGTWEEIRADLSKQLGLAIVGPPDASAAWSLDRPLTAREVLLALARDGEPILELTRIRLVSKDEAALYWRQAASEGRLRLK